MTEYEEFVLKVVDNWSDDEFFTVFGLERSEFDLEAS